MLDLGAWPPGACPRPLEELASHADQLTDIGVPASLLGYHPPERLLPRRALEEALWAADTEVPLTVRDTGWRYLIDRVRAHGGRWYLVAIGAALVALRAQERRITGPDPDPTLTRVVQHHLAAEYVITLGTVGLSRPNVGGRLVWLAAYRAREQLRAHNPRDVPLEVATATDPAILAIPAGQHRHADELYRVLVQLVQQTRTVTPSRSDRRLKLTRLDAALVALCCVEKRTIDQAAAILEISPDAARGRLPRAKRTVAALLRPPHATAARNRAQQQVGRLAA